MEDKTPEEAAKDYSWVTVLGLTFSVLAFFGFGLCGYLAVMVGIYSLRRVRRRVAMVMIVVGLIWGPIKSLSWGISSNGLLMP